jgi:HAE1 family hydrophobic/amphiphilic exporter-1
MALGFYSPNGTHDATFIGNYVNIYVKRRFVEGERSW